ncbi:signal transduction histidine kinase [Pararhizobium capsulatum DSM 1112]|uniref:histidine kinase n=1 Tax=Pararhizobium capsulatum DSM 1112 TaxID=1121113 RepID=A0ABU0BQT0_9HYPH|nr:ATP-binding protein [Pararhizobium capsulatum]MDQ0319237.1 signal transduction histidine kinase [Pararhizobium capsulatum DSM 1112]
MATVPTGFSRTVPLSLFAGALLLLGLVLAALVFASMTRENSSEALDAAQLNNRTVLLLSLLQDAETSQRGYVLTGNQIYLRDFQRAAALANLQFVSLQHDLGDVAIGTETIRRLGMLVARKLDAMKLTADLEAAKEHNKALSVVTAGDGERLMLEIRQIITRIDAITNNVGFQRSRDLTDATWMLIATIAIGAVLLVLLVGGAMRLVMGHSIQIEGARTALAEHNDTLEARIRQRTQYLERANRELQSYSYIVSHDLRAPLVNIMGFTSEFERAAEVFKAFLHTIPQGSGGEMERAAREAVEVDIPEALGFIHSSTKRMDELITEILKLARAGSRQFHPQSVDLKGLFAEIVATSKHGADETNATIEIAQDLPVVESDRLALQQVFGNLVENALKYSAPGRPPIIKVKGKIVGEEAIIEVADNGRGIAEQDLERVFELFRRSGQQDRPGDGVGLSHVRALVRRLGGDVTVRSTLGTGTTFTVTFAAKLRQEGREENDNGPAGHHHHGRG